MKKLEISNKSKNTEAVNMITNISKKNLWVEDSGKKKITFSSLQDLKDYVLKNFERLALPYTPPLSEIWEYVLGKKFGNRDWTEGIKECGYDTTANGYINQYSGEKSHYDCNVRVFGTSASGDAWYAYDGGIFIEFIEGSIVEKNKRLEEIRVQQERLFLEKARIEDSL